MTLRSAPVLLFVLALVALLGIIFLSLAGESVPDVLSYVVLTATGGAAGAAVPAHALTARDPQ